MANPKIIDTKIAYVVWVNTDLTEGKGQLYAKHICAHESTARRLAKGADVQGTNARVEEMELYLIRGDWYSGGRIIERMSEQDKIAEKALEVERAKKHQKEAVLRKAKSMGLSDAEIEILKA